MVERKHKQALCHCLMKGGLDEEVVGLERTSALASLHEMLASWLWSRGAQYEKSLHCGVSVLLMEGSSVDSGENFLSLLGY